MDNRPIGVFDSGLGGLTAVKQLEQVLPGESLVYFGDTGRVPYGSRGKDTILRYARQDMDFLLAQNVKAVLAACGTVSSVARSVGEALSVPYIDVIGPSARAAAAATKNGKIGVIGTAATIASDSYRSALLRINHKLEVYPQACPLFVSLVESGFVSPQDEVTRLVAERYLAPVRAAGVDTLILGCTHYPIIAPTVAGVMGRGVTLIDSGREAALALAQALKERDLLCEEGHRRQASYFVTDTPENFLNVAELFLGHSVEGRTQRIDIESYPAETHEEGNGNVKGRLRHQHHRAPSMGGGPGGDHPEHHRGLHLPGGRRFIAYKEYDTEDPQGQLHLCAEGGAGQSDHDALRLVHPADFGEGPPPPVPVRHGLRHLDAGGVHQRAFHQPGGSRRADRHQVHAGH